MDVEHIDTSHGICEMLCLKRILDKSWDAYKYVDVGRNLIKEKIDDEATCMPFIPTVQREANMNIQTKRLFLANFEILEGVEAS